MMEKSELRREISRIKKTIDSTYLTTWSERIMAYIEQHIVFQKAKTILCYYNLPDEVQTAAFLQRHFQTKTLLLPVVVGDDLILRRYEGPDSLAEGPFHIPEPQGEEYRDYREIDLVLVPGVAFDPDGYRLGRGKGYYDRLLPRLKYAYSMGICFPFQYVDKVPTEIHDAFVDEVVCHSVNRKV